MKSILIATENPAKFKTYSIPVKLAGFDPQSLSGLGIEPVAIEETSKLLAENSSKKAVTYAKLTNQVVLATDEGFYVDCYPKQINELILVEPRRLGMGRRLSDLEVIEKHNHWLDKYSKQGYSAARFYFSLSIAIPGVNNPANIQVYTQEFQQETILYIRQSDFPPIKEGYPLDSQSRDPLTNSFLCDLTKEDLKQSPRILDITNFISKTINNNV